MGTKHRSLSAIALLVVGLPVVGAFLLFGGGTPVTFAQVAEKLRTVHSMSCTARTTMPGQKEAISIKMEQLGSRMRTEVSGSIVTIIDQTSGQSLMLVPMLKSATLSQVELKGEPQKSPAQLDPIGDLRALADQQGESVAEQQIGGVKAKGIRCTIQGKTVTVWVDPKTKLPVRIEMAIEFAGDKMNMVLDDLVFDPPLDEARFSLEPPPEFTLTELKLPVVMNIEENVVTVLQSVNDGKYPDRFNDQMVKQIQVDDKGKLTPGSLKVASSIGALQGLLFSYEKGKTYDYYPSVKPGDRDAIVFWRKDKDSGKIMAVYGDLKIVEIQLAQVPPPAPELPKPHAVPKPIEQLQELLKPQPPKVAPVLRVPPAVQADPVKVPETPLP